MIDTLTIKQLSERWPQYSELNIFELANQGHFGLYYRPRIKRQTFHCVIDDINKMIAYYEKMHGSYESYTDPLPSHSKNEYKEAIRSFNLTKEKLLTFIKQKSYLFQNILGFERLAVPIEVEACRSCEASSIEAIITYGKIILSRDVNNTFAIAKIDDRFICNSYRLHQEASLTYKLPEDYKGYIDTDDLFVMADQIEAFEKAHDDVIGNQSKKPKKKYKQTRAHALKALIDTTYQEAKDKTPRAIWVQLKDLADSLDHQILTKVEAWTSPNPKIHWVNSSNNIETTSKKRFRNIISELNNPK